MLKTIFNTIVDNELKSLAQRKSMVKTEEPRLAKSKKKKEKKASLQGKVRQALAKKFGHDAVLVDKEIKALAHMPYGIIPQAATLCLAIGRPGLPAGRLTEIMGAEASCKSTLGYHLLAETQRLGGIGILVETEEAFETSRLKRIGIEVDDLVICQPKHMEQAFGMMEGAIRDIRKTHVGPLTVVWDSVAATPVMAETESEYDDDTMAAAARFLSKAMRKFARFVAEQKVVVVFINQLKANLDKYSGEKWISYGGKAVKFHSSLRFIVKTRKSDLELDAKKEPSGQWIIVSNVKNRIGVPYKTTRFFLNFSKGIDQYRDLRDFAIETGIVKERGAGRVRYKKKSLTKKDWKKFIKGKFGSAEEARDRFVLRAIKKGILRKYDPSELVIKEEKKSKRQERKEAKEKEKETA